MGRESSMSKDREIWEEYEILGDCLIVWFSLMEIGSWEWFRFLKDLINGLKNLDFILGL